MIEACQQMKKMEEYLELSRTKLTSVSDIF
jgi:hypothetical protein